MAIRSSQAVRCQSKNCRNRTSSPDQLCYAHRGQLTPVTPRGQLAGRGGGPLAYQVKLAKEEHVAVPSDTAGVPGFPYFTLRDRAAYDAWMAGAAPRPSAGDVLDRYPVSQLDVLGTELTGREVGVYDSDGQLHAFVNIDGTNQLLQQDVNPDGSWTRIYPTEYGLPYAIRSDRAYTVVTLDHAAITALHRS